MQWHHIVEQNPSNRARFQAEWLHSDLNVIRIDEKVHRKISAHYSERFNASSKDRIRDVISRLSIEDQYEYGKDVLKRHGIHIYE